MYNFDGEIFHVFVEGQSNYDDYYNEERIDLKITFLDGPLRGRTIIKDISAESLKKLCKAIKGEK